MKVAQASIGARVVDSLPFAQGGTSEQARALKADRVDCVVGYLGARTKERLTTVLAAGLAFMPVTFAGEFFDGPGDEIAQLRALGIPPGCTVWLDLEGKKAFEWPPNDLIVLINTWANAIAAAGYVPGLYVGVPQPLTSDELWGLRVARYWRGQGSIRDRNNALVEPTGCGWTMLQTYPSHYRAGVWVDDNIVSQDYRGRVPSWVVA